MTENEIIGYNYDGGHTSRQANNKSSEVFDITTYDDSVFAPGSDNVVAEARL